MNPTDSRCFLLDLFYKYANPSGFKIYVWFQIREILFSDEHIFYSSKYIIVEIFKHKYRILKGIKTADESEVYEYLNEILQRIRFINEDFISITNYAKAYQLCKDVDEFDVPFVALALELDAELWTNDKKLKTELLRKGFDNFFRNTR